MADIARAGKLDAYRRDLKQDIECLDSLRANLLRFQQTIQAELRVPDNHHSQDTKLAALIEQIQQKRQSGNNQQNQKVLILTVFKGTAFYLFEQLKQRGFERIGEGEQRSPPQRGGGCSPSPLERWPGGEASYKDRPEVRSDGTPNFFRTTPENWKILKEFARNNRKNPTDAENILWQHLRTALFTSIDRTPDRFSKPVRCSVNVNAIT
ncbi:hypothetical protein U27_05456 [Candidatus Vecturithrix granuli]|uniref:Uncharacterized protein n=1 Tax=Vecturithrix granuli TaxID=1499967 RepID=A0A081C1M7_VECG1|nr:hypothetical protein U27_05456 [Candidatus Vecturithrix granuli]